MPARRRSRATRLTRQAVELSLAVPQVVSHRVRRFAFAGSSPSANDQEEFFRMGAEKVFAFYESWNGMFLALYRANLQLFLSAPRWPAVGVSPLHGRRAQMQRVALDILAGGIGPIHRRAVANARRLRK